MTRFNLTKPSFKSPYIKGVSAYWNPASQFSFRIPMPKYGTEISGDNNKMLPNIKLSF